MIFSSLWENGVPLYGILIKVENPSDPNDYITFASKEHPTGNAPRVEVSYDDSYSDTFPSNSRHIPMGFLS